MYSWKLVITTDKGKEVNITLPFCIAYDELSQKIEQAIDPIIKEVVK